MRVLLVAAATSTTGGGERHVADLLRQLPAHGFELSLACPPDGDLTELAESLEIPVHPSPLSSAWPVAGRRELRHVIERLRPAVVHAHGSRAAFYARLADPSAARRCVYTVHGIHVDRAGSALRRRVFLGAERALSGRTARFVCVCASDCEKGAALGMLDPERATVIYSGIELPEPVEPGAFREELGLSADTPLVLSVGRFSEPKDQRTLIEAWSRVAVRYPSATLALIGGGELEKQLRSFAEERGVRHSVRFVPPRPDLRPAYTDADLFALSSLWEGLPYVVLEAMAHELPVIATAVDGIPEAVADRRTGLLVPPADPRTLAEAIIWAIGEREIRGKLGAAARRRVAEEFALAGMVERVAAVYREVAGEPAARSTS